MQSVVRWWGMLVLVWPGWAVAGADQDGSAFRAMPLGQFVDLTSLDQLADIVVTDAKVAQPADSATQSITVLRGAGLDTLAGQQGNLAALLQFSSGQFVNVLSRNDANWGSYGGLGPKYNSYLLDGLPADSFADAMSIDVWAIERVEAYKGPAAVMYSNYLTMDFVGNEAPLAGTTHFILRERVDAPLTRMQWAAGSAGTVHGRLYHQGRREGLSYFAGASIERADYTQYGAENSWLQTSNHPDYRKLKVYAKLSQSLGRPDHTLSLFVHHAGHEGDMGRPNRDFDHRYDMLNLAYANQLNPSLHLQVKAGQRRSDRSFANDNWPAGDALISRDTTGQTIRPLDLTLSYLHGPRALLTVGADAQWVDYRTASEPVGGGRLPGNEAQARSTGLFAQEKLQWQDWVFRLGLRHNRIQHRYALLDGQQPAVPSADWRKTLWSLGLRYSAAPGVALYANAGSSFMVPSAKQIGGTVNVPTASGELANPGLRPESGLGRDLGLDWQPAGALKIGVRAFLNTLDDAIVTNVVSAIPSQTRSENAGSARSTGVALDLRYAPAGQLGGFANLTRTRTQIDNPLIHDQASTAIPFVPDTMLNAGLTVPLRSGWQLMPYGQWVGRYWDSTAQSSRKAYGHYALANLRLQSDPVRQGGAAFGGFVEVNNLFDRRHPMPFDFRDPGTSALAGVTVTF